MAPNNSKKQAELAVFVAKLYLAQKRAGQATQQENLPKELEQEKSPKKDSELPQDLM